MKATFNHLETLRFAPERLDGAINLFISEVEQVMKVLALYKDKCPEPDCNACQMAAIYLPPRADQEDGDDS